MGIILPVILVFLVIAFLTGAGPERSAALIAILWVLTGPTYHAFGGPQFTHFDPVNATFDAAFFVGLLIIALRSNRMWPLVAAGLALVPIAGHLALALGLPGMTMAYWVMTEIPLAFVLVVICAASWSARRRAKVDPGVRDWRVNAACGARR